MLTIVHVGGQWPSTCADSRSRPTLRPMSAIAFDDIDAINAAASEEFGDWGNEITVTQEMINQFADLTGDHQWIHVDVERCERESPFGGPIAHGFLTLSLMPSLISMPVQLTGMKNVVNFGSGGLQFRRPVPAGATLHARSRVVSAEKHKLGTLLTFESAIHVKDSPKPSLTYLSMILFQG
ncbi:MAG: MaoC family dehydratase [Actinobacteria bacterium]|nr:MaoC family dehydratase [Actinomycetota bacterium]